MVRSQTPEIMDTTEFSEAITARFYSDLARIHRAMGTARPVIQRLRSGPGPLRSVLDIGCGHGALLAQIRDATGARATGIDLKAPPWNPYGIEIMEADATRDALPRADAAVSFLMLHHLSETQVVDLIRNVGRSCRRFIAMDLVRHRMPLVLFSIFMAPVLHRIVALDGKQSIRRAYTGPELARLAHRALQGTGARFEHCVSRTYANQILDITYRPDGDAAGDRPWTGAV
jgi:SAM-dependent methyltransferase